MKLITHRMMTTVIVTTLLATTIPLQGCAVLTAAVAGGAMGGAVGYGLAYSGYEVRSPITRPTPVHAESRAADTERN